MNSSENGIRLWVQVTTLGAVAACATGATDSPDQADSPSEDAGRFDAPSQDGGTRDALADATYDASSPPRRGAIVAGEAQTCAITPAKTVKCWGKGGDGQLGDGSLADSTIPTLVSSLVDVVQISASPGINTHFCARTGVGEAYCWGANYDGQRGDGTVDAAPFPSKVLGLGNVVDISVGPRHSCATLAGGAIRCWGSGTFGKLGDGKSTAIVRYPVTPTVALPPAAYTVLTQNTSCAVTTTGSMTCWGAGTNGALGTGSNADSNTPVVPVGLELGVLRASAGEGHLCAAVAGRGVLCWGSNGSGQTGVAYNAASESHPPAVVSTIGDDVLGLSGGSKDTCAVTASGGVRCWGETWKLGGAPLATTLVPIDVPGLSGVVEVANGGYHTCALLRSGGVKCWGSNYYGALGNGTKQKRTPAS